MIYTDWTKKAMKLAYEAHHGQVDKGGMPYVFHPFHLAEQMDDEISTVAALLHDVVEDTDWTLEALAAEGFPAESLEVLQLLTHPKEEPYMDYIARLQHNPIAVKIKLADLRHNSDFTRLSAVTASQKERLRAGFRGSSPHLTTHCQQRNMRIVTNSYYHLASTVDRVGI